MSRFKGGERQAKPFDLVAFGRKYLHLARGYHCYPRERVRGLWASTGYATVEAMTRKSARLTLRITVTAHVGVRRRGSSSEISESDFVRDDIYSPL